MHLLSAEREVLTHCPVAPLTTDLLPLLTDFLACLPSHLEGCIV